MSMNSAHFRGLKLLGILLATLLVAGVSRSGAQQPAPAPAAAPQTQTGASSAQETGEAQTLHLLVGRSLVISSPTRIKRVSLADPEIAEAIVVTPTQVLVNGKKPGGVSLMVWDEADQSQAFELSVDIHEL